MAQPISDELKKNLRAVLCSKAGGIELDRLRREYFSLMHQPLPLCGFTDIRRFLQAVPDVAQYVVSLALLVTLECSVLLIWECAVVVPTH